MQNPFAHTYSIVARDLATGDLGVAVQSHWFSVGTVVPWLEAGVGAVATQATARVSYGPLGLDLLRAGLAPAEALEQLLKLDPQREVRQVALVDARGRVAVHTGSRCIREAGHQAGDGFSVQANMMLAGTVWPAMAAAYQRLLGDPAVDFPSRLLAALQAAQDCGGDIRGSQSAALKVVRGEKSGKPWNDTLLDLRVEDHPEPLVELGRLLSLHRGYEHMDRGDGHLASGEMEQAALEYATAARLAPGIAEIPFWHAVALADRGEVDGALPIFREVFSREPVWRELLRRLPAAGLLRDDPSLLERILAD